jgi:hypothetical protein
MMESDHRYLGEEVEGLPEPFRRGNRMNLKTGPSGGGLFNANRPAERQGRGLRALQPIV